MQEIPIATVTTDTKVLKLTEVTNRQNWPYRVTVTTLDGGICQNESYSNLTTAFREFCHLATGYLQIDAIIADLPTMEGKMERDSFCELCEVDLEDTSLRLNGRMVCKTCLEECSQFSPWALRANERQD